MKKHISFEHPIVWCRWINVNLTLATKDQHKKSPRKGLLLDMGQS